MDARATDNVSPLAPGKPAVAPPPRRSGPSHQPPVTATPAEPGRHEITRPQAARAAARPSPPAALPPAVPVRSPSASRVRVRVPSAIRSEMEREAATTGRSFGLLAYEAVARNADRLRSMLAPEQPAPGMAPLRPRRWSEEGGSPKVDLYLTPDERTSVNAVVADIGGGVTISIVFREALALRYPEAKQGVLSRQRPRESGGSGT